MQKKSLLFQRLGNLCAIKGQAILVHTLLHFVYPAPDAQLVHCLDKKFTNLCSVLEIYFIR